MSTTNRLSGSARGAPGRSRGGSWPWCAARADRRGRPPDLHRRPRTRSPLIDDWLHSGLILASSALCARGARRRTAGPARAAWWCFATALLLFGLGEIAWSILYAGGGEVPTPNPTDVLYLATYPLFMAGLVLMIRARVFDVPWHRWLDGFVLVLIVATPGVLLVIEPVLESAPIDRLGRAVTVAYPLGDVLPLGALVGTLPVLSWRLAGSWPWVAPAWSV